VPWCPENIGETLITPQPNRAFCQDDDRDDLYILDKHKDLRNKGSVVFMRQSSLEKGNYRQNSFS